MKNIQAAASRLKELQRKLARLGPIMRGSVVRLGPYKNIFFSLHKDRKTRLIYLGKEREQTALTCSKNYRKLLDTAEEMTILNMALLKQHANPVKLVAEKTGGIKNRKKDGEIEL